jgi:hypothetical protein
MQPQGCLSAPGFWGVFLYGSVKSWTEKAKNFYVVVGVGEK